jgi:hypothetical protein
MNGDGRKEVVWTKKDKDEDKWRKKHWQWGFGILEAKFLMNNCCDNSFGVKMMW